MLVVQHRLPWFVKGYMVLAAFVLYGGFRNGSEVLLWAGLTLCLALVVDAVWALAEPLALHVDARSPRFVEVGAWTAMTFEFRVTGPGDLRSVGSAGNTAIDQLMFPASDRSSRVCITSHARGVAGSIVLTVRSNGPLGLAGANRVVFHPLATPLVAGPPPTVDPRVEAFVSQLVGAPDEPEIAGVRPYAKGDRKGDVHWRSSIRSTELMVRERLLLDPEVPCPVTISVASPDPEILELALSKARHAVLCCLAHGLEVHLEVAHPGGQAVLVVRRPVATDFDAMLLLARAVPSPAMNTEPQRPSGWIQIGEETVCRLIR